MSNITDFTSAGSGGGVKIKTFNTAGAKTIVTHGGVNQRVAILDSTGMVEAGTYNTLPATVSRITADLQLEAFIGSRISTIVASSFAAPAAAPTGLTFDGTNLISCDLVTDLIYIHDGITSTILSSFASPDTSPYGLTFDGTNLISCDSGTDIIYIYDSITATYSAIQYLTQEE